MKEFQHFAREVVGRRFPDDLTVVIIVQEINMAGGFDIFDDTLGDVRVMDGMGGAALKMAYEISDPNGEVLINGRFDRFHKRMTPDSFFIKREHFPYIRELFKEWAKATKRELKKAQH